MNWQLLISTAVVVFTLVIGLLKILEDHKTLHGKLDAIRNYIVQHEKSIEQVIQDISQLKK